MKESYPFVYYASINGAGSNADIFTILEWSSLDISPQPNGLPD